jgi:hypothetical protein
MPRILQPSRGLKQKGGLADPWLTADERHRSGDDPSPEHEIEFVESRPPALQRLGRDVAEPGGRYVGTTE